MKSIKLSFRHDCDLPIEEVQEFRMTSPFDSEATRLRKKLQIHCTIYPHPESIEYFRSTAALTEEQKRHLTTPQYRYVIHPLSKVVRGKQIVIFFLKYFIINLEFYVASFFPLYFNPQIFYVDWIFLVINLILLLDVIWNFFIGYLVYSTREVVLDQKKIARHYLSTYFFFDIGAILGFFAYFINQNGGRLSKVICFKVTTLRVARSWSLLKDVESFARGFEISEAKISALCLIIAMHSIVHWYACILGFFPIVRELSGIEANDTWFHDLKKFKANQDYLNKGLSKVAINFNLYLNHLTIVLCHFFGAGIGHYITQNPFEMLFLSIVIMTGLFTYLVCVVRVLQLYGMMNISEAKYEELETQVDQFMVKKQFSKDLKKRVHQYYDSKMNKKFFLEDHILATLTEHLKMEILLYNCYNLISRVQIFKGLSRTAMGCILAVLKQEIYLPGDTIMNSQLSDGKIYFILYGTCGVINAWRKEVMHIEDGDHFGEISMFGENALTGEPHAIAALEVTEVYSLSKNDIKYCISACPEILQKLEAMARSKEKFLEFLVSARSTESISDSDILEELRRGRILHHGILRMS